MPDIPEQQKTPRGLLWGWSAGTTILAILAILGAFSDVWEAYLALFVASLLGQFVWLRVRRKRSG